MENKQLQFRTAPFGGFNKQDVINYLEQNARDHAGQLAELQHTLVEEQALRVEYEKQVTSYKAALAEVEERAAQLTGALTEKDEALDLVQRRVEALEAQLATLQKKLEEMTPAAEAYAGLKDRAAGIELEAHSRAQAIEEESRVRVRKTQRDLMTWLEELHRSYGRMKSDVETSLSLVVRELQRAEKGVENLSGNLEDPESALRRLRDQVDAIVPGDPEPLAVEGDELMPLTVDGPTASASDAEEPQGPVPFTREGEER